MTLAGDLAALLARHLKSEEHTAAVQRDRQSWKVTYEQLQTKQTEIERRQETAAVTAAQKSAAATRAAIAAQQAAAQQAAAQQAAARATAERLAAARAESERLAAAKFAASAREDTKDRDDGCPHAAAHIMTAVVRGMLGALPKAVEAARAKYAAEGPGAVNAYGVWLCAQCGLLNPPDDHFHGAHTVAVEVLSLSWYCYRCLLLWTCPAISAGAHQQWQRSQHQSTSSGGG